MVANLQSLEELTTWEEYREFMKVRLKQLPDGECRFFLSKKKLDFDESGKPWKGRAVLIGPKGEIAAKKLKKDGVLFLEGTCRAAGKELSVEGIEGTYLKGAALTLKRMKLGYRIAGVDGAEDGDGAAAGAATADGPEAKEAAELEKARQALLAEVAELKKLKEPANKGLIQSSEQGLAKMREEIEKKAFDRARARLDIIENFLAMAVEGPEPAGDPDLTVLDDWKAYRAFLKVQLKKVPKEGGSAYISRKPQTFSIDGKEFKGHAVLFGPKARVSVAALKRYGTLFMDGTMKVEGRTLKMAGFKKSLLKGANKTMLKLRLGKRIVRDGYYAAEDETSAKAEDGSTGKRALDKIVKEIAESLVKLREAIEKQKKAVPGLQKKATDARKRANDLTKAARDARRAGTDTQRHWDDAGKAQQQADHAQSTAGDATKAAARAAEALREMTERLHQIRDSKDSDSDKRKKLKKLKADIAAKQLDTTIANIDPSDPKAGKLIAGQIKKRFGVSFKLNESRIMGRDANGDQIFKDKRAEGRPEEGGRHAQGALPHAGEDAGVPQVPPREAQGEPAARELRERGRRVLRKLQEGRGHLPPAAGEPRLRGATQRRARLPGRRRRQLPRGEQRPGELLQLGDAARGRARGRREAQVHGQATIGGQVRKVGRVREQGRPDREDRRRQLRQAPFRGRSREAGEVRP